MADGGRPCPPWLLAPPGEEQASQDKLGLCPPPAPPSPPTPSSPGPVPVQTSFVRPLGCPAPLRPAPCPSLTTHSPTGPTSSCHPSCTQAPAAPLTCPGSTTNPHSPLYPPARARMHTHIHTHTHICAHTHMHSHTLLPALLLPAAAEAVEQEGTREGGVQGLGYQRLPGWAVTQSLPS